MSFLFSFVTAEIFPAASPAVYFVLNNFYHKFSASDNFSFDINDIIENRNGIFKFINIGYYRNLPFGKFLRSGFFKADISQKFSANKFKMHNIFFSVHPFRISFGICSDITEGELYGINVS